MEFPIQNNIKDEKSKKKKIVICGGGVMGASIAYRLSERGAPSTVIGENFSSTR